MGKVEELEEEMVAQSRLDSKARPQTQRSGEKKKKKKKTEKKKKKNRVRGER